MQNIYREFIHSSDSLQLDLPKASPRPMKSMRKLSLGSISSDKSGSSYYKKEAKTLGKRKTFETKSTNEKSFSFIAF
jgi:hypothetical protein